jgi:hypothetical protein
VDILGHIFEQSITDLERLRLSLEHPGPVQAGASAKSPAPAITGALAPSEGERDGVRGPIWGSRTQSASKCRRVLAPRSADREREKPPAAISCARPRILAFSFGTLN